MLRRHSLPKAARLLKGAQFERVFASRRSRGNALFRIHHAPSDQARLGMTVSRRVSKSAVGRNRIRRQIRESFRCHRDQLPGQDFVVVARSAAALADTRTIRVTLDQLWQGFCRPQR